MQKFMQRIKFERRDNGRTPFQWDNTVHAGFTSGKPWIKVNPNYNEINAAAQEKNPNSVLNYFRKVVKLRKDNLVLVYGKYTLLDKNNPKVYSYTREREGQKMLILLNFSPSDAKVNTGLDLTNSKVLLSNYQDMPSTNKGKSPVTLRPYEAVIYNL